MKIQSHVTPQILINTLVLASLGVFLIANSALAQSPSSLTDLETGTVSSISDQPVASRLDEALAENIDEVSLASFSDAWRKSSASCDSGCDSCGQSTNCCCKPWWAHRCGAFAEFLLLRPGSVDHIYAIEQNDTTASALPTGPVGRVNVDSSAGFRVGFSIATNDCTSLVVTYTGFEGNTSNTIAAQSGNVLNSQIIHPNTETAGTSSLQSSADYSIDFQMVDLAYRHLWRSNDCYAVNWLAGFRYGNMEQDLQAYQDISTATGLVTVDTDVDFDGFGLLLGVDGERRSGRTGLMCYGRAQSSFLAGNWRGSYTQSNQISAGVVGNKYEDYRVTPITELELGVGWRSCCGRFRASVGYLTSAWFDAVSTREYVNAVRNNNYNSVDDTITFSGLTARLEANF